MRVLSALAVSIAAALVTAVASGTNGLTIVHPAEIAEPLVNPYCGWGVWSTPTTATATPLPPTFRC